jgi:hypothetical protein
MIAKSEREALFAEARHTPLTRGAIVALASRLDLAAAAEQAPFAFETAAAPHVATVLASALDAGRN